MMQLNELKVAATNRFQGMEVNFFHNDNEEYWVTREQVGQALGYADPADAIEKIHNRNVDNFSGKCTTVKMSVVQKSRWGSEYVREMEVWVYNRKGVMEICRHSNQPLANLFMEWVWDRIDELMRQGYTTAKETTIPEILLKQVQWMIDKDRQDAERDRMIAENKKQIDDLTVGLVDINEPLRSQFNSAIRELASHRGVHFSTAFRNVYRLLGSQNHVNIRLRADRQRVKPIDVVEELNLLVPGIQLIKGLVAGTEHDPHWN